MKKQLESVKKSTEKRKKAEADFGKATVFDTADENEILFEIPLVKR